MMNLGRWQLLLALTLVALAGCSQPTETPIAEKRPAVARPPAGERPRTLNGGPHPRPRNGAPAQPNGGRAASLATVVNEELAKLPVGRILPFVREPMQVDVTTQVEARIEKEFSEELFKGLERRIVERQVEEIKVSTFMAVRLDGPEDAFTIKRTGSEEQIVADRGVTRWTWDVTPRASGTHPLTMTASVRIKLPGGGEERKDHEVFRRTIQVRVNWLGVARSTLKFFFVEQWTWTITFLFGSGGAVWWVRKRLRGRRRARP